MAVEKQPDDSDTLPDSANDWFRQFLKHLEMHMVDTGQGLAENAKPSEYGLATMRAIKLTLLDSGLDDDQILALFGRVALEPAAWTELTHLMREHVSSDLPLEGAKKLHRRLTDLDSDSTDSQR